MEKNYDGAEKRKFKRMIFSAKDEVMGVVAWPGDAHGLRTYQISDISAGGMRFILSKGDAPQIIDHSDPLYLREIKGKPQLGFIAALQLQVRWVIEHEMFEHMVIGCEFVDISEDVQKQIDRFVESELQRLDREA